MAADKEEKTGSQRGLVTTLLFKLVLSGAKRARFVPEIAVSPVTI